MGFATATDYAKGRRDHKTVENLKLAESATPLRVHMPQPISL